MWLLSAGTPLFQTTPMPQSRLKSVLSIRALLVQREPATKSPGHPYHAPRLHALGPVRAAAVVPGAGWARRAVGAGGDLRRRDGDARGAGAAALAGRAGGSRAPRGHWAVGGSVGHRLRPPHDPRRGGATANSVLAGVSVGGAAWAAAARRAHPARNDAGAGGRGADAVRGCLARWRRLRPHQPTACSAWLLSERDSKDFCRDFAEGLGAIARKSWP
jgi:hypothetical protein